MAESRRLQNIFVNNTDFSERIWIFVLFYEAFCLSHQHFFLLFAFIRTHFFVLLIVLCFCLEADLCYAVGKQDSVVSVCSAVNNQKSMLPATCIFPE